MDNDEKLEAIFNGLKQAVRVPSRKELAIRNYYDEKIIKLRRMGLNDEADRWQKLKKAALEKM